MTFRFAANGLGGMILPIIVERLLLHYGSATTLRAFAMAAVRTLIYRGSHADTSTR